MLLDFSQRESLIPKRKFVEVFYEHLSDWKANCDKQTGFLGFTIRDEEDGSILHLSQLESEFYRKLDQINITWNNYLSMFRAAREDSNEEQQALDSLVETCMQYRLIYGNLIATWRKLVSVYFPLIQYTTDPKNP